MRQSTLLAILLVADQALKAFARTLGDSIQLLPGIKLTQTQNTGVAFGTLQGMNWLFMLVSVVALLLLYHYRDSVAVPWRTLLAAGILGNLIDRMLLGSVTDMIDLGWWPVFNLADSCLVVGIVALVIRDIRATRNERQEERETYLPASGKRKRRTTGTRRLKKRSAGRARTRRGPRAGRGGRSS